MNAISRFRVTFFNYFYLHEDGVSIDEGDNGEERRGIMTGETRRQKRRRQLGSYNAVTYKLQMCR